MPAAKGEPVNSVWGASAVSYFITDALHGSMDDLGKCGSVRALTVQCSAAIVHVCVRESGPELSAAMETMEQTHIWMLLFCSMKCFTLHQPMGPPRCPQDVVLWLMLPAGWMWTKILCSTSGTQMCLGLGDHSTCRHQRSLPL